MIGTTTSSPKRKLRTRKPGRPKKNLAPAAGLTADIKQTMLNTTINLIAERGFDGFALRDVAEAVGVHTALVGYYFKSKMQLEQAAFDHHIERNEGAIQELRLKLKSLGETDVAESFKNLFSHLVRVLDRGEISFKFNRWTLARGGKFAKELNDRLHGVILQELSAKVKSVLPQISQADADARALMFFGLAEMLAHLGQNYVKPHRLKGSEREIVESYFRRVESQILPELLT